jgi:branched-chain amino acid transport system permease protein
MLPGGVFSTRYQADMAVLRTKTQWLLLAIFIALIFCVPVFANNYWLGWLTRLAIVIIAVTGLHILIGLAGQVSLGHAGFVLLGAYVPAVLGAKWGINGWLCLPISIALAGVVGVLFGLPCFRLKGLYLAISTLAASYIIRWMLLHFSSLTGGFRGISTQPLMLGGIDFRSRGALYAMTIVMLILATIIAKNIQRTSTGRAFVAIRDNELVAQVGGIAIFRYKMLAFFIACMFAGLAGWLWSYAQPRLTPDSFTSGDSMLWLGILIIGGMGSTTGVYMGTVFIKGIQLLFSDYVNPFIANFLPSTITQQVHTALSLIVVGMIIVAFMLYEPHGLYSRWQKIKAYYRMYPYS